jgi:hypothetical protein
VCLSKGRPEINRFSALIRAAIAVVFIYPIAKYFGFIGVSVLILVLWTIPLLIQINQMKTFFTIDFKLFVAGLKDSALSAIPFIIIALVIRNSVHSTNFILMILSGLFCCLTSYSIILFRNKSAIAGFLKGSH